jgi:hypothetical protein
MGKSSQVKLRKPFSSVIARVHFESMRVPGDTQAAIMAALKTNRTADG